MSIDDTEVIQRDRQTARMNAPSPVGYDGNGFAVGPVGAAEPNPVAKRDRPMIVRGLVYGAVVVAAIGGVYLATHGKSDVATTTAGHAHGATSIGGDIGKPVMLSPADELESV